jgi:hypothetical protein
MSTSILNPRILGQAENAHRALLERFLTGTGLTYQRWVALTLVAVGGHVRKPDVLDRLVSALKTDREPAGIVLSDLAAAGLLGERDGDLWLSDSGRALYQRIRAEVDAAVAELYRDIPTDHLEIAGRVLTEITMRADRRLQELKRTPAGTA